jgi:Fe-S-cluster containining protein
MPIFYECDRCTACCRWPGQVKITGLEIVRMAGCLGISEHDFIQAFTRVNADRSGLALADKDSGECIFLDGDDCRVNPVKPQQCRNFPNLWNFPGFEEVCRAKRIVMEQSEYEAAILRTTGISIRAASR